MIVSSDLMTRMSDFKTGLFFLASVVLIVGGLFWVGTTGTFQDSTTYVSYFDSSVQGLATGSTVSYHGLKVGTVQSLELVPGRDNLIRVLLSLDSEFKLKDSMVVQPAMQGISGQSYLAVTQAPDTVQELTPEIDFPVESPVIPGIPGRIEQVENALARLYAKVKDMDLDGLLGEWASLAHAARESIRKGQLGATLKDARTVIQDMKKVTSRLEEVTGPLAGTETREGAKQAFADLSAASSSLREIAASLERELDRLDTGTAAGLAARTDQTLGNVDAAVQELRAETADLLRRLEQSAVRLNQVLANLRNLVRSLQTEPGRVLDRTKTREPFDK